MQLAPAGRLHCPALLPVAQQTLGDVQVTAVPAQTPAVHTSLVVHALLSLHAVPFGLFSTPQTLFTQVARWHWFVGVGQSAAVWQQFATGVPVQTPPWHVSPDVHGLLSSQLVPFGLFSTPQTLLTQVARWHWSVGVGQSFAVWQQFAIGV